MLRLAEILLEPRPAPAWAQLRQLGVEEAVGVLPAWVRRLARACARAALGVRPARALPPSGRGCRLPPHRDRGQPADGPASARASRAGGGARDGSRAAPDDGQARDRSALLQLDGRRPVVANVRCDPRPGRRRGDRVRRGGVGGRPACAGRPGRGGAAVGDAWPGSSSAPFPLPRRRACVSLSTRTTRPCRRVRGIGRIIRSLDAYDRVFDLQPSPANGMTMCQGNVALMTDDLPAAIRRFGAAGRIHFVHFRDVRGTPDRFVETFVDEGPTDMAACIRAYLDAGVDAPLAHRSLPVAVRGHDARAGLPDPGSPPRRRLRPGPACGLPGLTTEPPRPLGSTPIPPGTRVLCSRVGAWRRGRCPHS